MQRHTSKQGNLVTAAALTGSWVTQGETLHCGGYDQLALYIDYTAGDETSCDIRVQFSLDKDFTVAYEEIAVDTDTSGKSTVADRHYEILTDGNYRLAISMHDSYCRVQAKATAGTPTGTVTLDYRLENIMR